MSDSTATGAKTHIANIHDFGAKLRQPSLIGALKDYVRWQSGLRQTGARRDFSAPGPDAAPLSINLDLTTACNYACDHCVDMDILNTGIRYQYDNLTASLDRMWKKGLKSVILIGGGEPTVDPNFTNMVRFLKERGIHVAVVTNGSGMKKILEVAELFGPHDWVRLSLDSGTDATFQAMHKPKKPVTLQEICAGVPPVKKKNPTLRTGFSFIITWKGAFTNDTKIVENLHEMVEAARLAREHQFDYISFKPFLVRAESNNAEIVGVNDEWKEFDGIIAQIRTHVDEAKKLETASFKVVESTNLRVLENKSYRDYTQQPAQCHMQFFRQVLSPLGLFNCPVYRHVDKAKMGGKDAFATDEQYQNTRRRIAELIGSFNATQECREVTCLYNPANWFIEDLICHPEKLETLEALPERADYFL